MTSALHFTTTRLLVFSTISLCLLATNVLALILVGKGNDPVADHHWPAGSVELANQKNRLGWSEGPPFGGGQFCFLYHGTPDQFQTAVDLFAKITSAKLRLVIQDGGPRPTPFLTEPQTDEKKAADQVRYDWSFTIWDPENWKQLHQGGRRFSAEDPNGGFGKDVEPPQLDVFVGGDEALDISHIHIPANLEVTDERADKNGFKNGSAVIGNVTDLATGKPIAGAKVELATAKGYEEWENPLTVQTDAQGRYQFINAPKGYYGVLGIAPGYAPRLLGYTELRGNTFKKFAVQLARSAKLTGTAVDEDGKPVAGVIIRPDAITGPDDTGYILPKRPQAVTDSQGRFELDGLPPGHTQIFAHGNHYLIADALAVQAIPATDLKIRVVATGDCKGRVIDSAGKPDARCNVSIRPEGGEKPGSYGGSMNVGPDGTFHFENVPPGKYILGLMLTNPGPAGRKETPIEIKASNTTEVELKSSAQ